MRETEYNGGGFSCFTASDINCKRSIALLLFIGIHIGRGNLRIKERNIISSAKTKIGISLVPRPSAASFLVAYMTFEPPSEKLICQGIKGHVCD